MFLSVCWPVAAQPESIHALSWSPAPCCVYPTLCFPPNAPYMCLLPSLSLVTNNAHSWWKAQLCGNPWQRNVSICQAWVMPGSVAWLLSVVSVGPGLKVFVSTSHTPHRWRPTPLILCRPLTITTSEELATCKLLHLPSLDVDDTLFFLTMLQWKTPYIAS